MNKRFALRIFLIVILFSGASISGYITWKEKTPDVPAGFGYVNREYGFFVSLPESWKGYSVSMDKWEGYAFGGETGDKVVAEGPLISIHNPKWTGANSYQDIPIMVFTAEQWDSLQADKFHIGAAPINPSELARNSGHVFALPARYNFAYPPGFEEVDKIMQGKPVTAF